MIDPSTAVWRPATTEDIATIVAIENEVHTLAHERPEIFAEKVRLFGEGCMILARGNASLGYAIAHPWLRGDAPPLDAFLGALPKAPDCLFIHDVALRPEGRGHGAGQAYVRHASAIARRHGWPCLALVSVYGTAPVWERCGFGSAAIPAGKLVPYGDTARYMTAPVL